ncbi:MAG TPA: pentapeptide repeat-containing protein [Xanthomonadaceae bacterium]
MSQSPTSTEIIQRYKNGERLFADLELYNGTYDFSACVLDDADFSRSSFYASFSGASLVRAKFINAYIKTSDFTNADLRDAVFECAAIDGCIFDGANLSGASFAGASEQGYVYQAGEFPHRTELGS